MTTSAACEHVLITGASGFIGSHLAAHLAARGNRVRCLVRRTSRLRYLRGLNVELAHADLAGKDDLTPHLAGIDAVYGVAGVTRARRPADYHRGNSRAAERLARACLAAQQRGMCRLRRLVFVSSLAAAGPCCDGAALMEDAHPRPISLYGLSKLRAEQAVRRIARTVPITIVRPPIVYGPRDTDFYLVLRSAARGWVVELGHAPDRAYSLVHVADLVRGLVLAGDSPQAAGQTYYLSGDACSWPELLGLLGELLGRPVRSLCVPRLLGWCAGAAAELAAGLTLRPMILNRDKVREACQGRWVCATGKAARELGYAPALSLAEGLRQTIDWYRQQGWL